MTDEKPGDVCPECGAAIEDDRSCQQIFDEFLVLEFSDPGYGQVHFLTVACFMIQHRRYSREALTWIGGKLRDYLEKGVSAYAIRRQANRDAAQDRRDWKVTRQPEERELPPVKWSKHITEVKVSDHSAEGYCREIEDWARTTLAEMQVWIADERG